MEVLVDLVLRPELDNFLLQAGRFCYPSLWVDSHLELFSWEVALAHIISPRFRGTCFHPGADLNLGSMAGLDG